MLNNENRQWLLSDKRRKKRISCMLGIFLSAAVAVTSLAYKQEAAYVPHKEIGPGINMIQDTAEDEGQHSDDKTHQMIQQNTEEEKGNTEEQQNNKEETVQTETDPTTDQNNSKAEDVNLVQSGGRTLDLRKPMIALTFDDGPDSVVGNEIMDSLEAYDGRATFFLVGDRVASRKNVVKRMAQNGHELANHSMNHKNLKKLNSAEIQYQINACNDIIEQTTGVRPTLMRLPGGNKNELVMSNINMPVILWNIDTRDWATKNAAKTVEAVVGKIKDGDIVLMHELYKQTAEAVKIMLPQLKEQGYQFVTVSELIKYKGKTAEANKIYYHFHP